jgi:queuine/archaeosine tRNA-ribosyltransferase
VNFCLRIMRDARAALIAGRFEEFQREFMQAYRKEKGSPDEGANGSARSAAR